MARKAQRDIDPGTPQTEAKQSRNCARAIACTMHAAGGEGALSLRVRGPRLEREQLKAASRLVDTHTGMH